MSIADNKTLFLRWFEDVVNQRKLELMDELLAEDYVLHFPGMPVLDRDGHRRLGQAFLTGFADWHEEVEAVLAEGDRTVAWITGTGTHTGEFQGVAPTGRTVSVGGVGMARIHQGTIAEMWACFDTLGLLQQLGALPAPVQA
jgi:steroid delta-isomerase-like uncharacterized protein